MTYRHFLPGLILSGFVVAVAGCQSSGTGASAPAAAGDPGTSAQPKVKESDLQGYCPRVVLRDGTAYVNMYAKGGQDDPNKLQYQAAITDVTRSCTREGGKLNITVAVAGRVVPGPAGVPASVTLPIRIVALQGEAVAYSQLQKHPVSLSAGNTAATQFVFNDPNLSLPDTGGKDIQLFAGFDEGPPKKKKPADEE